MSETDREVASHLLDPHRPVDEKATLLREHLDWKTVVARGTGIRARHARALAMEALFEAAAEHAGGPQALTQVLQEIERFCAARAKKRQQDVKAIGAQLRQLKPGTAIRMCSNGQESTMVFLGMKRTRFVCEDADGQRFSVPADAFAGVVDEPIQRLSEKQRQQREVVRALAGRSYAAARHQILAGGAQLITACLEELAAALKRIETAPRGISRGIYAESLGVVKKVNPRDLALKDRIPKVLIELAQAGHEKAVVERVRAHADPRVRERVLAAINS